MMTIHVILSFYEDILDRVVNSCWVGIRGWRVTILNDFTIFYPWGLREKGNLQALPSGKHLHSYGQSACSIGKIHYSSHMFNSYVSLPEGKCLLVFDLVGMAWTRVAVLTQPTFREWTWISGYHWYNITHICGCLRQQECGYNDTTSMVPRSKNCRRVELDGFHQPLCDFW